MKLEDIIYIGNTRAIVSNTYDDESDQIEVVYIDQKGEPIAEDVHLVEGEWEFVIKGPCGTYARNSKRLHPYINILKRS